MSDSGGIVFEGPTTTDADGNLSIVWDHLPALEGVFEVTLSFAGDASCDASSATESLAIAQPNGWAHGAGKYDPTGTPGTHARFAFTAKRTYDATTHAYVTSGHLAWTHKHTSRLRSTSIVSLGTPHAVTGLGTCTEIGGTGTLQSWDPTTSSWSTGAPTSFVATACDGGRSGHHHHHHHGSGPDAFGLDLPTESVPGESAPVTLTRGSITVR